MVARRYRKGAARLRCINRRIKGRTFRTKRALRKARKAAGRACA